jgi:hypothetical protein
MSRFDYIYTDFSSGELSPLLLGRSDTDKYKSGVKILENFYIKPHGPAIARGGTKFVAETKYSDKITRLIPFAVSVEDTFILEFGDQYIRFYTDQGQLVQEDWVKIADPAVLPTGTGGGVTFSPDGTLMAVAHNTTPFITIYNTATWTKLSDPTILPTGNANSVVFNYNGTLMAVSHLVSPYITIYNTSDWSKVVDPAVLPTGTAYNVDFNHDGTLMAVAHSNSPFITIYNTSDWTKVTNPSILPVGIGQGVAFSRDDSLMTVTHSASPYITIYNTSDWSKVADPAILPTGSTFEVDFSYDGTLMVVAHTTSPYITIYNISDWSKVADPAVLPTGNGYGISFSHDGALVSIAHNTSPFVTIYNTSDWSKIADPAALPAGVGYGAAFNNNKSLMAISHAITPFVSIYPVEGPYEIATTYTEDELFEINFIQSADVLYLVHKDHAPAILSRLDTYNWTLANVSFTAAPAEWIANNYPTVIVFHEERLLFAATPDEPQTLWGSKSASYHDMTIGAGDADAFKYTIASDKVNTILWMSSGEILVIGTSGAEYKMAANSLNEAITPTNVNIRRQTNYGSKGLRAIRLGDKVIFVQKGGKKVRNFIYKFETSSYIAEDLTILSEHITGGKGVSLIDLGYCNEPDSMFWGIRSDGVIAGLSYEPDQSIVGWFRFIIAGTNAKVKSIACIDNATYPTHDDVWLIVERTVNGSTVQYIEFIKPALQPEEDLKEAFYIDSGLSYNESTPINSFSNLGHLEGETVKILADGGTHADRTVVGGNILLDRLASKVHIGLDYTPRLRALTPEGGSQSGSSQGKIKRISNVIIRLYRSLNILVGDTEFDRYAFGPGKMDEAVPLVTEDIEVPFTGTYERYSEIEIKQDQPLPLTIISIMSEMRVK